MIRADASQQMGIGHVMRCVALGQAWQDLGGNVTFISCELPESLAERIGQEGFRLIEIGTAPGSLADAESTSGQALCANANTVIVDGYHFSNTFLLRLREQGCRVLVVDDLGRMPPADLILNQNLGASADDYPARPDTTTVLAGCRFAMLRREFRQQGRTSPRVRQSIRRVLVSCGGSDPLMATERILESLERYSSKQLEVVAVAGSSNPRVEQLQKLAESLHLNVRIEHDCHDIARLMERADIAVVAAGSTCWEMVSLGLPVIAVITADNQIRVAEAIHHHGLGWNGGWIEGDAQDSITRLMDQIMNDPSQLIAASRVGRRLIDGQGAMRVAITLADPVLTLRPAQEQDGKQLWNWRNDEEVRLASFSTDVVVWDSHLQWLQSCLLDPKCRILMAENDRGQLIGQARLDIKDDRAVISISIAKEFRACGYGTALIRAVTNRAFSYERIQFVDAFIRDENKASQAAFLKAEYHRQHDESSRSTHGLRFVAHNPQTSHRAA